MSKPLNKPVMTMDMMKSKLREMQRQLVRPVTKENVFYHYLPMFGVKSYLELSINVFNPSLSSEIYKRLVQLKKTYNYKVQVRKPHSHIKFFLQ